MRSSLFMLLIALGALLGAGCATPKEGEVSSIPWNRPQQWEGAGALGGFGGAGFGRSGPGY